MFVVKVFEKLLKILLFFEKQKDIDSRARESELEEQLHHESQDNDDLISLVSSQHSGVCSNISV